MPRLRKPENKYAKLMRVINGYLIQNKVKLEDAMGVSRTTAASRRDNPDNFTLGELSKISRSLGIPIEELREAIPY